jgi:hypothetical protein
MGASSTNGQFRRIAVRPDWIDQSEVLGFVNPISRRFEPGWLAETIRRCESSPDRLFFVMLDEMNLAPVEQYLAEVLSAMEEARAGAADTRVPLYARGAEPTNAEEWSPELSFPANLVLIGTVNVDETTRPLSDRVIDRCNVLQLGAGMSRRHHQPVDRSVEPWLVPFAEWRQICVSDPDARHHDLLEKVADILRDAGVGVGMRTHVELERFFANSAGVLDLDDALDWGLVQRIIPKIRGLKRNLSDALDELSDLFADNGAPRAKAIVDRWLDPRWSDEEFVDGTDARIGLVRP